MEETTATTSSAQQHKVIIITGANSGIGLRAAEKIYTRTDANYRVIMACRSVDKAQEAKAQIEQNNPQVGTSNVLQVMELDLSSFESVRNFAKNFLDLHLPLHVLVLNAGITGAKQKQMTKDGQELVFQTNQLGHFLLTNLLLDKLKESVPSRVVIVSSKLHMSVGMGNAPTFAQILDPPPYDAMHYYKISKLANVFFGYELSRRLAGTGVTVNVMCPGFIPQTNLNREAPYVLRLVLQYVFPLLPFTRSVDHGADCILQLALDDKLSDVTGKWFSDMTPQPSNPETYDEEKAKQLWDLCDKWTSTSHHHN
eukprot:TRINITY_DN9793_c0_g2_i1.p1 TRINITY_DN9793_c0_g2~~TRINITY_DN9793_c0_g2_i1.p1  ORF type:complete len:311 (-),score=65.19 TRINITY_DN9793_c0_g2_i1:112-1044(-)